MADGTAGVMRAEVVGPTVGGRGARLVAVIDKAVGAETIWEAVAGKVGEDVANGVGVGGEGAFEAAVGSAVGVNGVGGGVGGDNRKRMTWLAVGRDGDGGVGLAAEAAGGETRGAG